MLKILTIFIYFIRELIFDSKDEYDFKSSKFNTRKFTVFIFVIASLAANVFISYKVIKIAKHNVELMATMVELKKQITILNNEKQSCTVID
jgi:hypothetical protein